ncbi:AraC family transcriptional regulator [Paenibacillus sp. strain BS8-2]
MKSLQLELLSAEQSRKAMPEIYFPPFITLAHHFNAPRNWGIPGRALKQFQFQYVMEGLVEYTIAGTTYMTKRGDLIHHAPDEWHEVRTLHNESYVCLSIVFHFGESAFPLQELFSNEHFLGNFSNHPIENKLSQLVALYHQPGLTNQLYCQGLLLQIIHDVVEWRTEYRPRSKAYKKQKPLLVLIKNHILAHYSDDVSHADLERISGLSRNYIISIFNREYGMTPFEYLGWIRVERAKELAMQTNLSIGEIAEKVGYADVHTFGRMFKRKTGMSLSHFCASITTNS